MKAGDFVRRAFRLLEEAGLDGREAEIILHAATGITREQLYRDDPAVQEEQAVSLETMLGRRLSREPIAYITGSARFLEFDLLITRDVLVPRPETEWMVAAVVELLNDEGDHPARILDIGTGSGCIALALARAFPDAFVVGTDASLPALRVAAANRGRNGLGGRVGLVADAFPAALSPACRFDLIVSNPPYVAERDRHSLDPDVKDHEPERALFAGEDGLAFFRGAIPRLAPLLSPSGRVFLEIGAEQGRAVTALMEPCLKDVHIWRDMAGRDRVVAARRAGEAS